MDTRPAQPESAASALFPFCREIRSKKLYFARHPPRSEDEILDGSRHCWCSRTMQALGPDGEPVRPEECRAGRPCFRAFL